MTCTPRALASLLLGATVAGCFSGSGGGGAGTGNGTGAAGGFGGTGVAGLGGGGGGTGGVGAGGVGGTGTTDLCAQRARQAADTLAAVVEAADLNCVVDADCSLVSTDTFCHATCGALAGPDGKAQIEAAVASENQGRCASYAADGCTRVIPPCVPPAPVRCSRGTCTWDDGGAPDGGSPVPDADVPQEGCVDVGVSWRLDGGFVAYTDDLTLTPCRSFTLERRAAGDPGSSASCSNEVALDATVTADDVDAALANADVQAAFALAPVLFGRDSRPVDGTVFRIEVGGAVIEIGDACADPGCTPIPAGVAALRTLLQELAEQQRALPDCDAIP